MQRIRKSEIVAKTQFPNTSFVFYLILLPSLFEDKYFDHLSNDWYQRNQRNPQVHLHVDHILKQLVLLTFFINHLYFGEKIQWKRLNVRLRSGLDSTTSKSGWDLVRIHDVDCSTSGWDLVKTIRRNRNSWDLVKIHDVVRAVDIWLRLYDVVRVVEIWFGFTM